MKDIRRATVYALCATLFALAVGLGFAVIHGIGDPLDHAVLKFFALREGRSPDALIGFAKFLTDIGSAGQRGLIIAAFAALLWWKKRPRAALVMLVVPALAGVTSTILKEAFGRLRPALVPHLDTVSSLSFPSGHAVNTAAIFLLAALLLQGQRQSLRWTFAIGGTLMIGWSRLALGVHWPSDVIGGWMMGLAFALAGHQIAVRLEAGK